MHRWLVVLVIGCGEDARALDAAPPAHDAEPVDAARAPDAAAPHSHAADAALVDAASDAGAHDGAPADAWPVTVIPIACPPAPALTVLASSGSFHFAPDDGGADDVATIAAGAIVRFTMGPGHDASSGARPFQDGQFYISSDDEACFTFTAAGMFPFFCTLHFFDATIVVAP